MLQILKPFNERLAYGYLSAGITATVILIVGGVFLLLLLPLGDEYMKASSSVTPLYENAGFILKKGNFYAYQIGMAIWGIGGLIFCYLLYRSRLVPRPFPIWGYAGYLIFISGTILEIYGLNIGVYLAVPGGII